MPRYSRKNAVEATEQKIGQDGVATIEHGGDSPELVKSEFQVVDDFDAQAKDHAKELAFMEELVKVVVHQSSDKHSNAIVTMRVNGNHQNFIRGEEIVVKRMYVERLARCKPVAYRNEEYIDASGARNVRWPSTQGLEYPFSVIEDHNPRGPGWLKKILAQP